MSAANNLYKLLAKLEDEIITLMIRDKSNKKIIELMSDYKQVLIQYNMEAGANRKSIFDILYLKS